MKADNDKTLVVITGPTAVGKTRTTIEIANLLSTEIISADARQFYKELIIGTAAPTPLEMSQAKHHFINHLSIFQYYNASIFEQDALTLLEKLFRKHRFVLVTGGSGLYLDALCYGIDDMPDSDEQVREKVKAIYAEEGLTGLRNQLKKIDPDYYNEVDLANPNRMMRGLEVFLSTGQKFSDFRKKQTKSRPFHIKHIVLNRPRAQLIEQINTRTNHMIRDGLIEEAIPLYRLRHLNALNTVGYKELFSWLDNEWSLSTAIEKIKTHTRRYAKRQITWFKRYPHAKWFEPHQIDQIMQFIQSR